MHCYYYDKDEVTLADRSELTDGKHQVILSAAKAKKKWLRCGCRADIYLWLIPYDLSPGIISLRRRSCFDSHAAGCPFAGDVEPINLSVPRTQRVVYPESMLLERTATHEGSKGVAGQVGEGASVRYEDLTHFIQAVLTRAQLEAFRDVNCGKSPWKPGLLNPSLEAVMEKLVAILREPLLGDGSSTLQAALDKFGFKLAWGVTHQPLVEFAKAPLADDEELEFGFGQHWCCQGKQPTGVTVKLDSQVLACAQGKVMAWGHLIRPPYFFAVLYRVANGENRATFMLRIPVCLAGGCLHPDESDAEHRAVQIVIGDGIPLIKLHVLADMTMLGALWPLPTDESGRLPRRPDLIIYLNEKIGVIFVTDTDDPDYHKTVDSSVEVMRAFFGENPMVRVSKADIGELIPGKLGDLLR